MNRPADSRALLLAQIQQLTGHPTPDATRMALMRAGVKANGVAIGPGAWPPKKLYPADAVWHTFGNRILDRATEDPEVKELCWEFYGQRIITLAQGQRAAELYGDRTS